MKFIWKFQLDFKYKNTIINVIYLITYIYMKKLFSFLSFNSLKKNIKDSFSRFPISFLFMIIIAWLFYSLVNFDLSNEAEQNISRFIFSWIIWFFLSLWVYLSTENYWINWIKKILFQIPVIIFTVLFFIWFNTDLDSFENIVFFILTLTWIISFLFFAPYIKNIKEKKLEQNIYYTYFYRFSTIFLVSFILGWLLVLLWNIAIFATFELFDISYNDYKIIANWMVTALCLITPTYALIQVPKKEEYNNSYFNENIFFSFLIKYIAIPFIYVYFIILYAYSIKVLSNFWDWPKWEVSWLVIGFSTFGYIIYIFSYIFEEKNKFIKLFRKYFPYAVIPQIFMLAYAIYLRINQYDLTVNRYFVMVFGLWLFIISIYLIFSKRKYLSFITTILTIFTIIISIWPWWVYNLPVSRQYDRLVTNLEKANILQWEKIVALKSKYDIDKELSKDIYSWIDYLCDFDNCNKIKELFENEYNKLVEKQKKEAEENYQEFIKRTKEKYPDNEEKQKEEIENMAKYYEYKEPRQYQIINYLKEEIKLISYYEYEPETFTTITYNSKNNIFPIDLSWYTRIYSINSYNNKAKEEWSDWAYANMDTKNIELNISWEKRLINIENILDIISNYEYDWRYNNIDNEKLTFDIEWYKLIIENIDIKNKDYIEKENNNDYYYQELRWYLLQK